MAALTTSTDAGHRDLRTRSQAVFTAGPAGPALIAQLFESAEARYKFNRSDLRLRSEVISNPSNRATAASSIRWAAAKTLAICLYATESTGWRPSASLAAAEACSMFPNLPYATAS